MNAEQTTKNALTETKPVLAESAFSINPELPIGMEFWIKKDNRVVRGLIAAYRVYVTSCVTDESWHTQLFRRFRKKEKQIFKYSFSYEVKLESDVFMYNIKKIKGNWFLENTEIYFSKDDLLSSFQYLR